MRECLIAQLSIFRDNEISMELLTNYFNDFAEHRYDKIISKIGCSKSELKEAIEVISQLNPHPGDGLEFSDNDFVIPDICIENNLVNTIKLLQSNGYWIVGLENSIEAKKWFEIDYKGKIAIVLGSEGKGIRKLVKESCDFLATIPMRGNINSLNVTAALSAILFERNRQLSND